jgi:hypothetical protein
MHLKVQLIALLLKQTHYILILKTFNKTSHESNKKQKHLIKPPTSQTKNKSKPGTLWQVYQFTLSNYLIKFYI